MAALPRLAAGLLLALVVVSSAQALVLVGPRETIPGSPGELVVSAGIVYVVTSTGLLIYDASDVDAGYALLGSHPGSFVTVEVRGTIAYVVGPGGLQIVDVRDPASPIGLGTLPTDRQSLDLEVVGTRAYIVVTPLGLRVVDVSHPATPALLGALDLDSQPSLHFAAVAVEGGVAYLNSVVGAVSVDVADPAAPALIARFDFGSPVFGADIAIRNHILYATADASAKAFPSLRILDVTDPAAPLELAHIDSACMDLALAGVVLYCTDSYQLHLFDVSDPSNPLALGVLRPGVMGPLADVAVARGIAHVATGPAWPSFESSLQAVDTRVRAFPARNGFSGNVPDSLSCLSIAGKHLYAGSSVAMDLFDIRDPMNPALVGSIRLPGSACDVIAVGWIAYTATETNLALVDVSDPSQPQLLTLLPSPARSLARAGNRLFVGRTRDRSRSTTSRIQHSRCSSDRSLSPRAGSRTSSSRVTSPTRR